MIVAGCLRCRGRIHQDLIHDCPYGGCYTVDRDGRIVHLVRLR